MSAYQLILTLLILVAFGVGGAILVSNRRAAQRIADGAAVRGWRYIMPRWVDFTRPYMNFAGHTTRFANWELRRIKHKRQIQYSWRTFSAPLQYGCLKILPSAAIPPTTDYGAQLHLVDTDFADWPNGLFLYSSHAQLAQLLQDQSVLDALGRFAPAPTAGSLTSLVWQDRLLIITCTYQEGWEIVDKLVTLGEAILESCHQEPK